MYILYLFISESPSKDFYLATNFLNIVVKIFKLEHFTEMPKIPASFLKNLKMKEKGPKSSHTQKVN